MSTGAKCGRNSILIPFPNSPSRFPKAFPRPGAPASRNQTGILLDFPSYEENRAVKTSSRSGEGLDALRFKRRRNKKSQFWLVLRRKAPSRDWFRSLQEIHELRGIITKGHEIGFSPYSQKSTELDGISLNWEGGIQTLIFFLENSVRTWNRLLGRDEGNNPDNEVPTRRGDAKTYQKYSCMQSVLSS